MFDWPVAVAFRRDDTALRDQVQAELDRLAPWIAEAEARYGFPEREASRTALAGRDVRRAAPREEGDGAVIAASGLPGQGRPLPVLPAAFVILPRALRVRVLRSSAALRSISALYL